MISSTSSANSSPIPNGWRLAKLGDVADIVGGSTPSRAVSGFWGGEIPWVVPSELTGLTGRYLKATNESVTQDGMEAAGLRLIPAKSVLLTSRATIGATAINSIPVVTNQGFQNLIPNSLSRDLWLYYAVSAQRGELERRAAGSTFKEVSRDSVRSLPILLPPLHEQRRIAEVLDSIDEAIERAETVITSTEQLRDALLHDLLTKGVPGWHTEWKDAPNIGSIPACWEVARLGDVAEVNPRRPSLDTEHDTPVNFVPMAAVDEGLGGIQETLYRPYADVSKGYTYFENADVLFAKITPCLQNGKHTLINGLRGGYGFGTTEFHVLRAGDRLDPRHLFRVVTQSHNIRECADSFTGTAGQQRVQPDTLREIPVPLPPLPEQQAIAEALDGVESAIDLARTHVQSLKLAKASVADALLTGRVRVVGK